MLENYSGRPAPTCFISTRDTSVQNAITYPITNEYLSPVTDSHIHPLRYSPRRIAQHKILTRPDTLPPILQQQLQQPPDPPFLPVCHQIDIVQPRMRPPHRGKLISDSTQPWPAVQVPQLLSSKARWVDFALRVMRVRGRVWRVEDRVWESGVRGVDVAGVNFEFL